MFETYTNNVVYGLTMLILTLGLSLYRISLEAALMVFLFVLIGMGVL